jgi:DNA ligase (NAD+)
LNFFAYNCNLHLESQKNILEKIKILNFFTEKHSFFTQNLEEIFDFLKKWTEKRNSLPYEID